jgi:D-alanyl-D-alanine carboxypeptidase
MKRLAALVFVPLALAAGAMAAAAVAAPDDSGLRAALSADLQKYLASRRTIEHISALSLSVKLPGQASNINVTAGTTRYDGGGAVTPGSLYQIGSNTKAFPAVTILQLEGEGKLTIQDTVGKWLPQYPAWKDVTIERLLNMTSGIPTYDNVQAMLVAYAANPTRDWSPAELIAYVYPTTKGAPPPTTGWSYSNANYLLAQLIIEKASGRSYTAELQRRFLANPALHLDATYYRPHLYPPSVTRRMVSGYFASKDPDNAGLQPIYGKDVRDMTMSWAQGAGGIVSRPEDVARWSRALYVGDLLKPQQRRELMRKVSQKTGVPINDVSADDPHGFGLGVVHAFVPSMGKFWFYQGETLGYRMVYAWFPDADVVFAAGINSQPDSKEDQAGKLMESVYNSLHEAGKL